MTKASVTSSLFFTYYRLFLHVTGIEVSLIAKVRKKHSKHQINNSLDSKQVKFWRHIINVTAHLFNRKPSGNSKRTRQNIRNCNHPIRHQVSRPTKVRKEQYWNREIQEKLHTRFAMYKHLRKAHSKVNDRRKEHNSK